VPVPEMTPAKASAFERFKTSAPLSTMLSKTEPVVPPVPNCSVPEKIVVTPVQVLLPATTRVPVPIWFRLPLPEMIPANTSWSVRLAANTAPELIKVPPV
jgi:hypothetical protein